MTAAMAAELRRALAARGMSQTTLARLSGYGASNIAKVLAGERYLSPHTAARIAEALDWPAIVTVAIKDRTTTCALCGASFVRPITRGPQRYCGRKCRRAASARQSRDSHRRRALTETRLARERLSLHQQAVAAFCHGCEPEALCRDASCALRPVSPLPLADRRLRVA